VRSASAWRAFSSGVMMRMPSWLMNVVYRGAM
jgi:hypothetical protein